MKKSKRFTRTGMSRHQRGSMSIEVAITATLFVIFTILGFDMLTVVFGYSILDSAARDAARAAASTGNKADGLIAAQQAVLSHRTDGYFVVQPTVSDSISTDFVYYTPAKGSPFVTVTTRSQLRIQTPVSFFGAYLADGQFPVARSYTFPILGVPFVPSTVVASVASGATTTVTTPGTGSAGSGTGKTTGTGSTGSGSGKTTGTGSTGSGSGKTTGTGSTGSGSGKTTGTGSTPGTGKTGSGTGSTPGTGKTGSGTGSTPDTGKTGSGTGSTPGTGSTVVTPPPVILPSAGFAG